MLRPCCFDWAPFSQSTSLSASQAVACRGGPERSLFRLTPYKSKMMFRNTALAFALTASLLLSVNAQLNDSNPIECITTVTENLDYFPDKVEPKSSEFWNISYFNTYKILYNEIEDESYLLYLCGTEPPSSEVDAGHKAVIPVPVPHGVAVSQTTHIPYLELLGVRTEIEGYLDDPQYISSPCVNEMIAEGEIVVVQNTTNTTALDNLLDSSGENLVSFVASSQEVLLDNKVAISEFSEKSNTGTYEWIKYYSAFFNLEDKANELYEEVTERYECVAENAARVATDANNKPTVLWAYYSNYSQGWDVATCPNYYCEYASICSAELLNSFEGSIEGFEGDKLMTLDEFTEFGQDADHWIFVSSDWDAIYEANKDTLNQFKSVQALQVYDYQGSGSNAWFEQRLAEFGKPELPCLFFLCPTTVDLIPLIIFCFVRCRRPRFLRRRGKLSFLSRPREGLVSQRVQRRDW